jgi:hypothetical protein
MGRQRYAMRPAVAMAQEDQFAQGLVMLVDAAVECLLGEVTCVSKSERKLLCVGLAGLVQD